MIARVRRLKLRSSDRRLIVSRKRGAAYRKNRVIAPIRASRSEPTSAILTRIMATMMMDVRVEGDSSSSA